MGSSPTRGTESKKEGEQASANLFAKMIERLLFSIAGTAMGLTKKVPLSAFSRAATGLPQKVPLAVPKEKSSR